MHIICLLEKFHTMQPFSKPWENVRKSKEERRGNINEDTSKVSVLESVFSKAAAP